MGPIDDDRRSSAHIGIHVVDKPHASAKLRILSRRFMDVYSTNLRLKR